MDRGRCRPGIAMNEQTNARGELVFELLHIKAYRSGDLLADHPLCAGERHDDSDLHGVLSAGARGHDAACDQPDDSNTTDAKRARWFLQAGVLASLKRQRWPDGQAAWPQTLKDTRTWAYLVPGKDPVAALVSEFMTLWFPDPTGSRR
jgi:hypothetical protein